MPAVRLFQRNLTAAVEAASCEAMASVISTGNITMACIPMACIPMACIPTAFKAATVGASFIAMSPTVEPGACADEDSARKVARPIVAIWRACIRVVGVIAVRANRRTCHITSDANSNHDRSLRVSNRQGQ